MLCIIITPAATSTNWDIMLANSQLARKLFSLAQSLNSVYPRAICTRLLLTTKYKPCLREKVFTPTEELNKSATQLTSYDSFFGSTFPQKVSDFKTAKELCVQHLHLCLLELITSTDFTVKIWVCSGLHNWSWLIGVSKMYRSTIF